VKATIFQLETGHRFAIVTRDVEETSRIVSKAQREAIHMYRQMRLPEDGGWYGPLEVLPVTPL